MQLLVRLYSSKSWGIPRYFVDPAASPQHGPHKPLYPRILQHDPGETKSASDVSKRLGKSTYPGKVKGIGERTTRKPQHPTPHPQHAVRTRRLRPNIHPPPFRSTNALHPERLHRPMETARNNLDTTRFRAPRRLLVPLDPRSISQISRHTTGLARPWILQLPPKVRQV